VTRLRGKLAWAIVSLALISLATIVALVSYGAFVPVLAVTVVLKVAVTGLVRLAATEPVALPSASAVPAAHRRIGDAR
jgi:hypothetical protein